MTIKWKEFEVHDWLSPDEAKSIIENAKGRDKLILRTMWETGGRVSEVLSIIPKYVDTRENIIYLPNLKQRGIRKKRKESDKEYEIRKDLHKKWLKERKDIVRRTKKPLIDKDSAPLKTIYLFPESTLCKDLANYANENSVGESDWIFKSSKSIDGRVSPSYIWRLLCDKRSSNKGKKGISVKLHIIKKKTTDTTFAYPHLFRHGSAMYVLGRLGRIDLVKEHLGHSTVLTTEGYAKVTSDDRKDIIRKSIIKG